ncbi:isochorismatase family protein [Microbacterium sp. SYP-A9085]|uniref:cysteine hydrolase family protein n=1 Tax=Microbacterium sp. SYP-A9085 TaxID=2664454 RepID=UPI00129A56C7|nr:isochorismatase family protein [Microbacterium sp. SYP-A9085]MRH28012.1 isochorismatase family protein [Microbacterium sp. SYP-A9085]
MTASSKEFTGEDWTDAVSGIEAEDFEDHIWKDVVSDDMLEIYAPYRRETRLVGKPVFLAIDLFASVFPSRPIPVLEAIRADNPRSCGIHAWEAQPVIRRVLELARSGGHPVIYSTDDVGLRQATNRKTAGDRIDPADFRIAEQFAPHEEDTVVVKERASVFFGTGLLERLRELGAETVVICGETTSGCVRATAVDAYSHGFHVVLIEEGVFDRSLLNHKVSLFDLHHKYADVMKIAEFERKFTAHQAAMGRD